VVSQRINLLDKNKQSYYYSTNLGREETDEKCHVPVMKSRGQLIGRCDITAHDMAVHRCHLQLEIIDVKQRCLYKRHNRPMYSIPPTMVSHEVRIGHTRLTHSYLLLGTDQPECSACHCPLTVKHILIECSALTCSRNKHFTASSMKDLVDNVAARNIINFIKESHFYSTV